MKAAVFRGPEQMVVEEYPKPECGSHDVILKVDACAICGTDMRIYYHGHKNVTPPFITGHEVGGTIAEVGPDVTGYEVGDRVLVVTPVGCGRCVYCRRGRHNLCRDFKALGYHFPGGFAEYMKIPEPAVRQGNLLKYPDHMKSEHAALVEPLSCVVNGQEYLNITTGDNVLVIGAGPIGCMHAVLARASGAANVVVSEMSDTRLEMARRFGLTRYVNPSNEDLKQVVMEMTEGAGMDVVIVACSVKAAQEQALGLAAKRGRVSFFGGLPKDDPVIAFDSNLLHYNELAVFGAFASYSYQYVTALALVAGGNIDIEEFITHKLPLDDIVKGIEMGRNGQSLKVVVMMD